MSLGEAIEHFSLLIVRAKAGWLAGSFVDILDRDEGYLNEEFGTIEGHLEPFAIAPTVAEAVAAVTHKTDKRAALQRLCINVQDTEP